MTGFLLLPFAMAKAQGGASGAGPNGSGGTPSVGGPSGAGPSTAGATSGGSSGGITITNPLKDVGSISDLVYKLAQIAFNLGIIIASVYIILSGLKFVVARGKPEEIKKARDNFLYVVLGTAILLGAKIIVTAVYGLIVDLGR